MDILQNFTVYQWVGWSLFFLTTIGLIIFSRKSLFDPRHYGFYRFFAFEALTGVLFLSVRSWFRNPILPHHLLSWALMLVSLALATHSLLLLRRRGLPVGFWAGTTRLVDFGIYRYIRHPLYSALIVMGWGFYLMNPLPFTTLLIFSSCGLLAATAIIEEQDSVKKFGEDYRRYMARSKRFIPYVF